MTFETASELLTRNGQAHVLRFWDTLAPEDRKQLLAQIAELDFDAIARMRAMLTDAASEEIRPFEPADAGPLPPQAGEENAPRSTNSEILRCAQDDSDFSSLSSRPNAVRAGTIDIADIH